jgi:uncharacterized integral membrane protein (TIGR00697 family)
MEKTLTSAATPAPTRFLEPITGLFAGLLVISNICSNRLITMGPLEFDAGTLMFPLTYVFGDLLTEVYGFARSRRVIWTGFLTLFVATACLLVASLFPAPAGHAASQAWDQALALTPRIALASLVAYLAGEFANSMTLSRMKARGDNGPGRRFVVSTIFGQSLDTLIFASIAFLGLLDARLWLTLVVSNYVYKVGFEIILLPATLYFSRRLKEAEGLDAVDAGTSLNPFRWRLV